MIKLNYDDRYDILYIGFGDKENRKNSIGDEEYNGLVVMRDKSTDKITGLIIMRFADKYKNNNFPLCKVAVVDETKSTDEISQPEISEEIDEVKENGE